MKGVDKGFDTDTAPAPPPSHQEQESETPPPPSHLSPLTLSPLTLSPLVPDAAIELEFAKNEAEGSSCFEFVNCSFPNSPAKLQLKVNVSFSPPPTRIDSCCCRQFSVCFSSHRWPSVSARLCCLHRPLSWVLDQVTIWQA